MDSEQLSEELRETRIRLAIAEHQLNTIKGSPGWRVITAWRQWIAASRESLPGRVADRLGRKVISAFGADQPVLAAQTPPQNEPAKAPGRLIVCHEPPYNGRVFLAVDGRRHWALSTDHLADYGLRIQDAEPVSKEVVRMYANAGNLPRVWPESAWLNPPRSNATELREIAASRLRGKGVEFGAGTYPFSVPLECAVKFADFVPEEELRRVKYEAQGEDFVPLDYVTGIEEMEGIGDASMDFLVACHVIEHVRNPLKALQKGFQKVKPGGTFLLVVPEKTKTFDRDRGVTPLEHLIADYESPDLARDAEDYRDFFTTVRGYSPQQVQEAIEERRDLHYHTWTYATFGEMLEYCCQRIAPWRVVWSQPAIEGQSDSIEFYYVLER